MRIGMQVIIEDYVHDELPKFVRCSWPTRSSAVAVGARRRLTPSSS